jgi:ADP-ribose pyrophosphatase YjhB (NUDIX family)
MRDRQVLAVVDILRKEPVLPGGHLTWRETPQEGARREAREETGLDIDVRELIGVFSSLEETGEPGIIRLIFRGQMQGGRIQSSGEGQALWMDVDLFLRESHRDGAILLNALRAGPAGTVATAP